MSDEKLTFKWKKKSINTYGEILDAAQTCKTKKEAAAFVRLYKTVNPKYAENNLGYLFGYLDEEERERLYELFSDCIHPVFGGDFGREND